ncbi:hypothetical protein [Cohnella sp.]|uniref:hypothetical protein n=1 Tax=Cohnella sp. TaxID=1883426 RepID=UPI003567AE65
MTKIIYLDPNYWYLSGGGFISENEMIMEAADAKSDIHLPAGEQLRLRLVPLYAGIIPFRDGC